MIKKLKAQIAIFLIVLNTMVLCSVKAEEEKLTITSYYPSPSGSYIEISTTGNTYLAVTSGNVGIGTSTPQGKLQIGAGLQPFLQVSSEGNVGIGTTAGTYQLFVGGELYVTGSLICDSTSVQNNPRKDEATGLGGVLKMYGDMGNCTATVADGILTASNCSQHSEPP